MVAYSFVVTIYNDGYLADAFCRAFEATFQAFLSKPDISDDVELIFVNDGSSDDSLVELRRMAGLHRFTKVLDLSRNFGQHPAILCGYHHARGRYVGRLNVDMQDPPSEIPKLLKALDDDDVDIVIGIQKQRKNRLVDVVTARLFFWVFNVLTGSAIPQNTATLRVMNRKVADTFRHVNDKFPFMQGLETWFGFRVKYVGTEHNERADGRSSYTFWKRLKLGVDAAISFSDRPLRFTVYGGLIMACIGFIAVSEVIFKKLTSNIVPGYTSTMAMLLLGFGVQVTVVGLCGLYIGKILTQVQDRPAYLVRESINFHDGIVEAASHARINEDLVFKL